MTTAEFLNIQLEKSGLTRYALSKNHNLTKTTVSRLFSGKQEPTVPLFKKVCQALKVSNKDLTEFFKK